MYGIFSDGKFSPLQERASSGKSSMEETSMYLKKLELFGFKSFAEKTELLFQPGVTAIVGPNGCGKSNVFDAVRWVLGEQSIKELRGSAREDVIFNGTQKMPSLGMAEVSLTFSNESHALPVDYDEVTVTRRLFRSGESQYLMNKTVVRLRDIQELFLGTGVGAEAYSLLPQGKVDLIVSAKPEERRFIIDEASGITKYNAKKKEAMSKLRDTENNLLRLNDIITEVKRQIGSCERQAAKARRYKEKFDRLKAMETAYARDQIATLEDRRRQSDGRLEQIRERETVLTAEMDDVSGQLTNEINHLDDIEQKIKDGREEEIRLRGQVDLNERQVAFHEERIRDLGVQDERLRAQKEQLVGKCRLQQEKIVEIGNEIAATKEKNATFEKEIVRKRGEWAVLETLMQEARDKIRDNEEKMMACSSAQATIRNELTDIMKEVQSGLARKRRLDMEEEKLKEERRTIDEKLNGVEERIRSLQGEMFEWQNKKQDQILVLTRLRSDLSDVNAKIDELERRRLFLCSQREFIEKMHTQYQDMPDPVIEGRLITPLRPSDMHMGILGKVRSVHPIAGQDVAGLQGNGDAAVYPLYEIVCETKFVELDLSHISRRIEEIAREIEETTAAKNELSSRIGGQEDLLRATDAEILEREKALSVLEAQRQDIVEDGTKIDDEIRLVLSERSEADEQLLQTKQREDAMTQRLDAVNRETAWYQNDIREKQTWLTAKTQDKEALAVAMAQVETELQSIQDRLKTLDDSERVFREALDGWLEEMKKIEDDLAAQVEKKREYAEAADILRVKIGELLGECENGRTVLSDYNNQREDAGCRINAMRAGMKALEDELDALRQEAHQQQMSSQELSYGEKGIVDRLMQTYKIDMAQLPPEIDGQDLSGLTPGSEDFGRDLEDLRRQCDAFGTVNLVAIEEYEEMKQRFEFLTKQQADLLEAKSHLMNTIQKINRSTRQMFMDAFTKVSEEFRIYFRMLFGGGDAELVLIDPENVLESGIDIVARPPGKKLQNISLLSGGEKTLTAIALIFGVFKVNPSPFCVLDEIDAALDESNVGRFSFLLKEFAKVSQFIVITHNKKTMSGADVMYGITMPETGVSRVVSVKFLSEEEKRTQAGQEAAAAV